MPFLWFWTFWHWSRESFREGSLLRDPLHGVGGHWDEWYRHQASDDERGAIEETGRSESSQRAFIEWLTEYWRVEADPSGNQLSARFVLSQLALLPPFDGWTAFAAHRDSYGLTGVHAVVLAEESRGEHSDVRPLQVVTLPDESRVATDIVTEGFQADAADLVGPREAAIGLLGGKALLHLLIRWIASGRRPYSRWLDWVLALGWVAVASIIVWLLVGPEPGELLPLWFAGLLALWLGLLGTALFTVARQINLAVKEGQALATKLRHSDVRVRMNAGLMLKGGSAGLAYSFNMLLAVFRAYPTLASRSWLWRNFFQRLDADAQSWAATGVVLPAGLVKPVMLEPKLRACFQHPNIRHLLTPRQREATAGAIARLNESRRPARHEHSATATTAGLVPAGFAAESLHIHRCRHITDAMMAIGGFISRRQVAMNIFAVWASVVMLAALPDFRATLAPSPAPIAVPPASPTPYFLWVSLETDAPDYFQVVLESKSWTNRRAGVTKHTGPHGSVRAEIRLQRVVDTPPAMLAFDGEDGTVWIERRRRFLSREYHPGERVGRYAFSYLARLGHE
jgi:hypothetical protein